MVSLSVMSLVISIVALSVAMALLMMKFRAKESFANGGKMYFLDMAEFAGLDSQLVGMYKGAAGALGPRSAALISALWRRVPAADRDEMAATLTKAVDKSAADLDNARKQLDNMSDEQVTAMIASGTGTLARAVKTGTVKPVVKAVAKATRAPVVKK